MCALRRSVVVVIGDVRVGRVVGVVLAMRVVTILRRFAGRRLDTLLLLSSGSSSSGRDALSVRQLMFTIACLRSSCVSFA